jgi:tRNA threonylcarbamoyl adenosine modification protein (Sua5/YciO/YrdC/YwlC family)
VSERKDPAPDAGKPAAERAEAAQDRRPGPQAESTAASEESRASSGPAVPGEDSAAPSAAPPHGDPLREPAGERPEPDAAGAGEAAGDTSPEGASSGGKDAAAGDTAEEKPEEAAPAATAAKDRVLRFDCSIPEQRAAGIEAAVDAVRQGKLVVIPTDTVYGIGADAFTPSAVNALLAAKGRGRDMPVPVLVGSVRAANALLDDLGPYGQDLIDAFWPGPLTIIGHAVRSLQWDLGETKGTVAVRMPLHAVALDLLKETGPMAVSSANRSGAPPATTVAEAEEQLGDSVAVYLDGGRCPQPVPSTIVDLTTPVPRVLRKGAIPVEKLKSVVGYVATDD